MWGGGGCCASPDWVKVGLAERRNDVPSLPDSEIFISRKVSYMDLPYLPYHNGFPQRRPCTLYRYDWMPLFGPSMVGCDKAPRISLLFVYSCP